MENDAVAETKSQNNPGTEETIEHLVSITSSKFKTSRFGI